MGQTYSSETKLITAIKLSEQYNLLNYIESLLVNGTEQNESYKGISPLTIAICCSVNSPNMIHIIKLLIKHGAKVSGSNILELLVPITNCPGYTYKNYRNYSQTLEILNILLGAGIDPNYIDESGWGALGFAIVGFGTRTDINILVKLLKVSDGNFYIKNSSGYNVLDLAEKYLPRELADLFHEKAREYIRSQISYKFGNPSYYL